MDQLLELFHTENYDCLLSANLQIFQSWLLVTTYSKLYTVSTMLFHKDWGEHFSVTNFMSHFSMFVPTNDNVKFANRNTRHAQWIGFLFPFPNCIIIYTVVPVYHCPYHPSKTISLGDLNCYIGFKMVASETFEHCGFFTLRIILGDHTTRLKTI